ncbi:hypothetical protein DL765_003060 [Monosporascus sp. GIB2]|nr:hypothetical protein DL765_003060 [Monosporascus sp. GIB2]
MADLLMSLPGMLGDIASIINWCKEYYQQVRGTGAFMNRVIELLGAWVPQLELLEDLVKPDDRTSRSLRMVLANKGILEQTRSCLQELKELVTPKSDGSSPGDFPGPRSGGKPPKWYVKLTWPLLKQSKAEELLRELEAHKSSINLLLTNRIVWDMSRVQEGIRQVESHASAQERQEILAWLKPDKIDSHEIHLEKRNMREDETCDWMTRSDIWKTWVEGGSKSQNGHRRCLWIHGIPGAGKTVLASFLIDTIANNCQSKGYSYYYCSHQRNQDEARPFLQWVLADLCNQSERFIPQELFNLYGKHRGSVHRVLIDDLLKCLLAVTRRFSRQVCIAVDAVDESSKPRNHFMKVLTTIGTDPAFDHVSILLISRDELDIRAALEALPPLGEIASFLDTGVVLTPTPQSSSYHSRYTERPAEPSPTRPRPTRPGRSSLGPNSGPNAWIPPEFLHGQASADWQSGQLSDMDSPPPQPSSWSGGQQADVFRSPRPLSQLGNRQPGLGASESRSPSKIRKLSESSSAEPHTPPRGSGPFRCGEASSPWPSQGKLVPEISKRYQAYTELSMDNHFVLNAISMYVRRRLQRIEHLRHLRPEFLQEIEAKLAREARGMFRWVACQIDMIDSLELSDEPAIQDLLQNLPDTVFDTYERLIVERIPHADGRNEHNRTFARTALALICSNSAEIPSADVLVEASLFNVPRGLAHAFDIQRLERILGCLIKVTKLNRRPASVFTRDDDANNRVRVAPAHYTVKEYLFAPNTAKGPAKDFALTNVKTQILELEVVFNGLLQFGNNRPRGQNQPTRYEEYCLRMTEKALESRRALIVTEQSIWEAVFPCLKPNSLHLDALRNAATRQAFPKWAKLNALFRTEKGAVLPSRQETSILVSLLTLNWPELAAVYLKQIAPDDRAALWTDTFIMSPEAGGRNAAANPARDRTTILRLCVARRRIDFLEHFLEAGADFAREPRALFDALREPYEPVDVDAGGTTGQLLKMVLQRGADPNPPGYRYTPLQEAVRHLEERWVQSLLLEHADPNADGDPEGEHPYGVKGKEKWYDRHPLEICRSTRPPWQDKLDKKHDFDIEDQVERARLRVEALLFQFGATEPKPEPEPEPQSEHQSESETETEPEPAGDSPPERVVIMID